MSDVFISYARSTAAQANAAAQALRDAGYSVWLDEDLQAHRPYAIEIEAQLKAAKAALVIWSAQAALSEWVLSEANRAREERKLVQVVVDGTRLPMPFDQISCADLAGWAGGADHPGWSKAAASIAVLAKDGAATGAVSAPAPHPTPAASDKPSIAVMPFANLSDDPEQAYFADGMMEEIVSALARFKTLFVAAPGATSAFRGKAASPREVGRTLGVRYVLEGSVRRAGGRVRIAVKLVDVSDGAQVWGERFEDAIDDVFALQDKVALGVAGAVLPAIRSSEARRLSRRPTENMSSYDLYLRAWSLYRTVNKTEVTAALDLLERALALDPHFEQALGMAAACCGLILVSGWSEDPDDIRGRCRDFIDRALRAGGEDEVVLGNVAVGLTYGLDEIDRAIPLIDLAIAHNPGYAVNWLNSGVIRLLNGDLDIAVEHIQTAARLDPVSVVNSTRNVMAQVLYLRGRFTEALSVLRQSSLRTWSYHLMLALTLARLGKGDEAQAALARCREISPLPPADIAKNFRRPEHRRLILEGIALAEGRTPK